MTRNIDELNNLTTKAVEPEKYFGEMELNEEQFERRVEYTKKANELFDVILILLLTMRDNGNINYVYARGLLESWLLSLIAEFTTPDSYTIDYATDTAYNFVETTKNHIEEDWYTSSDRALYNAENSANDVLNYDEYQQAIEDGKTHKKWITEKDNKVRKTHKALEGKTIPIKDFFRVGLARMRFPKDYEYADMFPEETVNCRCQVEYLPKDTDAKDVENMAKSDIMKSGETINAVIPGEKIVGYCLNPEKPHYNEFADVGYSLDHPERLVSDILDNFDIAKSEDWIDKGDAKQFVQMMYLGINKTKLFKTVWQIDEEYNGLPRFITSYRNKENV